MAKNFKKPLTVALGAAFLASAVPAVADVNPFEANPLSSGYDLVNKGDAEGKCGEGKCGEGKCGDDKAKKGEGKCGEGKCGEGKCGGDKAKEKSKDKAKKGEGKCGEGKCGEKK